MEREREEVRPFLIAKPVSSEPRGREYSLGKGIPLNGSVLPGNGRCCASPIRFPRNVPGMYIPNAELVSFKIRLDLSRSGSQPDSHALRYIFRSTPFGSLICMSVSLFFVMEITHMCCKNKRSKSNIYCFPDAKIWYSSTSTFNGLASTTPL